MADLISACMGPQPELRPTTEDIIARLSDLLPPGVAGREALPARSGSSPEPAPAPMQDSGGRSSGAPDTGSSGPSALQSPLLGEQHARSSGSSVPAGHAPPTVAPATPGPGGSSGRWVELGGPSVSGAQSAHMGPARTASGLPAWAAPATLTGLGAAAASAAGSHGGAMLSAPQAQPKPSQVPRSPSDMMPPSPFS